MVKHLPVTRDTLTELLQEVGAMGVREQGPLLLERECWGAKLNKKGWRAWGERRVC